MTRNRSSPTIQQALKDLPIKEAAAVLATHDIQVPREILRLKKAFLAFLRANPPQRQRNVALALISAHVARKDKLNAARRRRHAVRREDNLEELGERDEIDGDGAEAPPLQRNQIIRPVNFGKVSIAPDDACGHCGALKMKGEGSTFCCNNGKYVHSQLGSYTEGFQSLLQWGKVADACRKVNNMFTLASMSTVDGNYHCTTPINLPAPLAVKIHGRIIREVCQSLLRLQHQRSLRQHLPQGTAPSISRAEEARHRRPMDQEIASIGQRCFIDRSATSHMTPHQAWFTKYCQSRVPLEVADGQVVWSEGVGDVMFQSSATSEPIHLRDVLHIPPFASKLFSAFSFVTENKNRTIVISHKGVVFMHGDKQVMECWLMDGHRSIHQSTRWLIDVG